MPVPRLTAEQVTAIRLGSLSDDAWAAQLGVSRTTVHRARIGIVTRLDVTVPPQPRIKGPRSDIGAKREQTPATVDLAAISAPGENWRPVIGWERFYRVSDLGRVYSLHQTGRLVIGMPIRGGYRVIKVRDGGRRAHLQVHCMVLEAFVGPRPAAHYEGCHNDGNPENCRLGNLRWDTKKANAADRAIHGTANRGKKYRRALNDDVVRQIRTSPDMTAEQWASRLGTNVAAIFAARRGATWKHVDTPPIRKRA